MEPGGRGGGILEYRFTVTLSKSLKIGAFFVDEYGVASLFRKKGCILSFACPKSL